MKSRLPLAIINADVKHLALQNIKNDLFTVYFTFKFLVIIEQKFCQLSIIPIWEKVFLETWTNSEKGDFHCIIQACLIYKVLDQNSVSGRYLLEKQPHLKGRFIEIDKPAQKGDIVLKQMNDMHWVSIIPI